MVEARIRDVFPTLQDQVLLDNIIAQGQVVRLSAGELLMDYGRTIRMIPLLLEGAIKVFRKDEQGNEILLYYLVKGQTCAMSLSCCLDQKISEIRAEAAEDVEFIGVPLKQMNSWMSEFPSWQNFIIRTYSDRFNLLLKTLDEIAFKKLDERLVAYLQNRASISGSAIIEVSHQEIALDLHSSREAVSRLLKSLEHKGFLKLGRSLITLTQE
ncbi:MAG: CRP/FNR family transcriptional regulator [Limisphaerales bacterium]|jgi:CRP/FNR family transcriptional regulator